MPEDQTHDAFPHSLHGTAFPSREGGQAIHLEAAGGMSLRDWFAGMAASGLVTGCAGTIGHDFSAYANGPCNHAIADRAYALADAMLEERAKR